MGEHGSARGGSTDSQVARGNAAHGLPHCCVEAGSRRAGRLRRLQSPFGKYAAQASALRRRDRGSLSARNVARQRGEGAQRCSRCLSGDGICSSIRIFIEALAAGSSFSGIRWQAAIRCDRCAIRRRPDGGTVAMLPGSRAGELRRHLPVMGATLRALQRRRPRLRGIFGAADERAGRTIRSAIERDQLRDAGVARGVAAAVENADAAIVASGTAVLETALLGVPAVAIYVIPPILIRYGHRMIRHRFITLPNLVLKREVVPELLQERATPEALADAIESLLADPERQYEEFVRVARGARSCRTRSIAARATPWVGARCGMIRIYHTSDLHDRRGIVGRCASYARSDRDCSSIAATRCAEVRASTFATSRSSPKWMRRDTTHKRSAIANSTISSRCCGRAPRACAIRSICTNLQDTKGTSAAVSCRRSASTSTGDRAERVRVHVLGLLVMQYPTGSRWERLFGWRFLDPGAPSLRTRARFPTAISLVVLSHVGLSLDRRLAARIPRIDLILGGHSHDTLSQPEYAGEVPIVHAGPYGRFVSSSELWSTMRARRRFTLADFALRSAAGTKRSVKRVLFVTNGHGEAAIAERIARRAARTPAGCALRSSRARRKSTAVDARRRRSAPRNAERWPDRNGERQKLRARPARRVARAHAGRRQRFFAKRAAATMRPLRSATSTRSS